MRYHLLKTFDTIYIVDLHGNARKKEATPDGSKDENVFDIMQGVSINIFVKNRNSSLTQSLNDCGGLARSFMPDKLPSPHLAKHSNLTQDTRISRSQHSEDSNEKPQKLAQIHHYDLYGKRSDKTNFLYENTLDSIAWATLQPKAPFYLFIPQNESLRAEYDKGWSVKDIFRVSNTGVVTKRDNLCIQKTKEKMWEAMQDILNLEKNEFYTKYKLPQDVRDWRYEWAKEDVLNNNSKDKIQKIAYRPFDIRYMFYSGKSRGFVGWPVPVVSEHFLQDFENCAISIPRQLKDTNKEWNHCMPTQNITDQALSSGGNGPNTIMPLYLKNTESSKEKSTKKEQKNSKSCHTQEVQSENEESKGQWIENFTPEFREFVDSKYNEHFAPEQILGYIYAVLFHKDYREKYIDFLKIDFPKIPFVESKEKFLALSALGQELMLTHLMQDSQQERERERERAEVMRMTCNIGLVTCRQVVSKEFTHSFIAHTIMESCYISTTREINYLFPLYLYQKA